MAKSEARKKRDKQARQKGYNIDAMKRGGQNLQIEMSTRMTKTKIGKAAQNKHKKRIFCEFVQETALFNLVCIQPDALTHPIIASPRSA